MIFVQVQNFFRRTLKWAVFFAGLNTFQFPVYARDYADLFATPRGLSLGGALTASVDDRSSLAYNPAGLALMESQELRLPDLIMAQFSPDILDVYGKTQSLDVSGGGLAIANALREFDGTAVSLGLDLLGMGWYRRQMAIQFNLLSLNLALRVRTPSIFFARLNAKITTDSGLSFGYAQPFLNNHFRVGFVFRPLLVRAGMEKVLQNQDIANLSGIVGEMGVGWGFDGDLGIQGNSPSFSLFGFRLKVLAGLVLQNLRAEDFSGVLKTGLSTQVPPLERRGSAGIALRLDETRAVVPTLNIDWREIGVKTDHPIEHLCIGAEFVLQPRTWFRSILRGHFSRAQWGGGIAGRLAFGELEIGTYAVNLGRGPGVGTHRRNYASLSARW